ncbi:MAG: pitrilysin family protein [Pyrinomonadaceae bacterium]
MRIRNYFKNFTVFALFLFSFNTFTFAQTNLPAPREQKLLNGLKLLVWETPNAEKTSVKLRIHSGSAFDPQAKEGVMALLGEILFPNETVKEYFEQDLGGSLAVESNYDYIQINATGDNDKILEILEAFASAVAKTQIDKDTTAKVKAANIEKIKEFEKNPAYLADVAVAKRLFGDYPYGRPQLGTTETVSKIDFADLMLAKQKFLNADNATLAVSGNVKFDFVYRAARRLFGGWEKADKKIPATFTQPDAPKAGLPVFDSPVEKTSEFRFALRGLARNDKDFYASQVLEKILQNRLQMREGKKAFVRYDKHILPGFFVFGVSQWLVDSIKKEGNQISLPMTDGYQNNFLKDAVKQEEFDKAKAEFLSGLNQTDTLNFWLDADTFKLAPLKTEWQNAQNVTIIDAQKVLEKLQKESAAYILVFSGNKSDENSTTSNK